MRRDVPCCHWEGRAAESTAAASRVGYPCALQPLLPSSFLAHRTERRTTSNPPLTMRASAVVPVPGRLDNEERATPESECTGGNGGTPLEDAHVARGLWTAARLGFHRKCYSLTLLIISEMKPPSKCGTPQLDWPPQCRCVKFVIWFYSREPLLRSANPANHQYHHWPSSRTAWLPHRPRRTNERTGPCRAVLSSAGMGCASE